MKIAIIQTAKLASKRIPNKPLQKIRGRTLLSLAFEYMLGFEREGVDLYFGCPATDQHLQVMAEDFGIHTLLLSEGRVFNDLIQPYLDMLSKYDAIVDANFMCHPFLSIQTREIIIELARKLTFPFVVVNQQQGIVWDNNRTCIVGSGELADTQNNPIYFTPLHVVHVYRPKDLRLTESEIANKLIPVPLSLTRLEQIDIDTPQDLELARLVAPKINEVTGTISC